ncbi:CoA transferase subunit A [Clostridium beijerinckii]|uniref:Acetate CoA/acetoacetate CoA-transferase alpha subunit n=1 Tax=Clostridium beijerinckii TaxID=1520 RepID=A0A9Q5CTW8_CLOBE|nr:CoA transferase subunit A [Clostridium beijerinckii]AQS05381.1 acetate CoA-transferase subunit alpha [Clostridium beijerinckii]MBA2885555.1 acetate CoA/acetoacetate CoA-transferase alpha subunit [Clostridium beijerinckii]MBA2900289.1 acetate CoA/acetoacetate CoA-transferase alpha subunit [Clostridium beijerinckii]MBA2910114.1 acetate CoA/acetoacetate CoA-transferase alpha subunit [Clostridium beijerinckii]MBA9015044.1 acetate CoA/acetoacetate CoA-transferase alpha subunit [Clostridium beije
MTKIKTVQEAVKNIKDGMKIMTAGFLGVGAPLKMIEELANTNIKDLTLIQAVSAQPGETHDVGKLIANKQIKKFVGAHIGTCPEAQEQYNAGTLEVEFIPMGTIVECIRAGGAGLGAVITPTGLGTEIEKGRDKLIVDGKEYLVFPAIKADVALIKGYKADKFGNILYRGTTKGTNTSMALAADLVIAEVDEIVEVGEIPPDSVGTPGILVDIIVQGDSFEDRRKYFEDLWTRTNKMR